MARHENFNEDSIVVYWTRHSQHSLYDSNSEVKASSIHFSDPKKALVTIKKLLAAEANEDLYRSGYVSHVTCSDPNLITAAKQ